MVYLHSLGEDTSFVQVSASPATSAALTQKLLQREMTLLKEVATFVLPRPEVRALQSRSGLRLRAWYDVPTRSFRCQARGLAVWRGCFDVPFCTAARLIRWWGTTRARCISFIS